MSLLKLDQRAYMALLAHRPVLEALGDLGWDYVDLRGEQSPSEGGMLVWGPSMGGPLERVYINKPIPRSNGTMRVFLSHLGLGAGFRSHTSIIQGLKVWFISESELKTFDKEHARHANRIRKAQRNNAIISSRNVQQASEPQKSRETYIENLDTNAGRYRAQLGEGATYLNDGEIQEVIDLISWTSQTSYTHLMDACLVVGKLPIVDRIDKIIRKQPGINESRVVYKGIGIGCFQLDNMTVLSRKLMHLPISTTMDERTARSFAGGNGIVLHIELPVGEQLLDVRAFLGPYKTIIDANLDYEKELLIASGGHLVMTSAYPPAIHVDSPEARGWLPGIVLCKLERRRDRVNELHMRLAQLNRALT